MAFAPYTPDLFDEAKLERACREMCIHGRTGVCTCPSVTLIGGHGKRAVPFVLARDKRGFCGPDAKHLDFPGLKE